MLLEAESWNKLSGSRSVKAPREMTNIARRKCWQAGAAGSCKTESTGL